MFEKGDKVLVYTAQGVKSFEAVLVHAPAGPGDTWIFTTESEKLGGVILIAVPQPYMVTKLIGPSLLVPLLEVVANA